MKALVYEHFNPLIAMWERFLNERGFDVFSTKSMDEAWNYFQSNDVDVIIVKFDTAYLDDNPHSIKFIEKIRGSEKNSDVFILTLGHNIYKLDEIRLMQLQVFAILHIPCTKAAFDSKLDEYFLTRELLNKDIKNG